MPYLELVPDPRLRPLVDRFWLRAPGPPTPGRAGEAAHVILPDGCIDVIVRVDPVTAALAIKVVGAMSRAAQVPSDDVGLLAAVRFRPGGAVPILGLPAQALTDLALDATQLTSLRGMPTALARAGERTAIASLPPQRDGAARPVPTLVVAALERWLLARAAAAPAPDPLVAHAAARLFAPRAPGTAALARELGWSRQHLRRKLLEHVGLAPKELARVARVQRAVAQLQRHRGRGLAELALDLGFFDQAHLARELRLLAGRTASELRAEAGSIFPIHSLLGTADSGHDQAHREAPHPQPDRRGHRGLPAVLGGAPRLREDRRGSGR